MNAKTQNDNLVSESNKGMIFLDKAQICFEKVQHGIATGGLPDFHATMRPHQREQVCRFQVSFKDDGYAIISADELNPLEATPVLGKLAHYLASEAGRVKRDKEDDPFVPFKDTEEIIAYMTSSEKEFTRRALKQAIHRLRRLLAFNGCRDILQSHRPRRAYRIRLRQKKFCDLAKPNAALLGVSASTNPPSPTQGRGYER